MFNPGREGKRSMIQKIIVSDRLPCRSTRLTVSKGSAGLLLAWLLWLGYIVATDIGAFWISLVFVPVFGVITWSAIRSNNIVLQSFAVFMFIAHAIGAPFLWLNRSNYGGSGFGSVGSFQFDLGEFFLIYVWVVGIYGALVWCTRKWDTYIWPRRGAVSQFLQQIQTTAPALTSRRSARVFDALLVGFVVLFMVPLNVYMSTNNIGTLGLLNDPLPFRLTGIMYYTRLCFAPLAILVLFSKSSRSWLLVLLIVSYALLAGLSSASRSVFLVSLFSVGYYNFLDRQNTRLVSILVIAALGFLLTSGSRDYTYTVTDFVLSDAVEVSLQTVFSERISFFDMIGGIANRFYGAQDFILAYQFLREETWSAMVNYFTCGGRADAIVPDLGRDLYDMDLEGTGFGVGIGTLAYFLILSHSNILVMPFAVLALGFLISAGNKLLISVLTKGVAAKMISHRVASGPLKLAFGGFMAFSLYSSSLNIFYTLIQFLLGMLFIHFLLTHSKISVNQNA
jgi:hypothetical protein